ncbi:MAG TPA: aspartate kinase [Bacteroidales bacterium]|nr:aspartate kinase [Bacteroidales bacterium]HPF04374.1 aspartate kinase [Bacteroidales bacterium]HPJ60313.1 aspartate kinase [Bacteroidales bacterium]HPR13586.1 aspartate kinase [Bacteroidales bacterium]HRW86566.1 aspartate kinase [Bacteroidales bacterium]
MKIEKIMKFGGTSVGSPERMKALIPLISGGGKKLIVLSAMSGTTNSLVEITDLLYNDNGNEASLKIEALRDKYHGVVDDLFETKEYRQTGHELINSHFDYINNFTLRVFTKLQEKAIVAQGELISTSLFYHLLKEKNIRAALLPALNFMRIDKDGEPDYFYIQENLSRELRKHNADSVKITQGFICRNVYGEIDNLKRGGSDYSASIIGAALKVKEIQIWTDISGFHNNDPRYVENTKVIRELSFDEAAELAYFGAKILHPSSVNPAREKSIPVRLKNTMEPEDEGTLITSDSPLLDYKAVAAKDGISVFRIKSARMLMAYGFLRKVFEIFEAYKTPIDMVTTSEVGVSLTIDNPEYIDEIEKDLRELGSVEVEKDQTIICIVGDFRTERTGSAPEIFEALDTIPLKMISYGGSQHSLSLLIDTHDKTKALRLLSKNIF